MSSYKKVSNKPHQLSKNLIEREKLLQEGYQKYKKKDKRLDPVEWALAQTNGSYYDELVKLLGSDFKKTIKKAQTNGIIPKKITLDLIKEYDKIIALQVDEYKVIRDAVEKYPGLGQFFEVDHLLEQRFYKNQPKLVTAFDEKGSGMGFLVPKNPVVAAQIVEIAPESNLIKYVHTTKTSMLRRLIPIAKESQFTLQNIWDAHIFTLKSLDADPSIYGKRLIDMFKIMEEDLGEKINYRILDYNLEYFFEYWETLSRRQKIS